MEEKLDNFDHSIQTQEVTVPVVPVNGVDLPPEVQEQDTPESEKIDFMAESEINPGEFQYLDTNTLQRL